MDGTVDPIRDAEIIELELVLADLDSAERQLEKNKRAAAQRDADALQRATVLEPMVAMLKEGKPSRKALEDMDAASQKLAQSLGFITSKPVLYVANVDEGDPLGVHNAYVDKLRAWVTEQGGELVAISGAIEAEIAMLESAEEKARISGGDWAERIGLGAVVARRPTNCWACNRISRLGQRKFAPGRFRWVQKARKPPVSSTPISSAASSGPRSITIADLKTYKVESAIRSAGKLRPEGKEYVVNDGDIMHFFSTYKFSIG